MPSSEKLWFNPVPSFYIWETKIPDVNCPKQGWTKVRWVKGVPRNPVVKENFKAMYLKKIKISAPQIHDEQNIKNLD